MIWAILIVSFIAAFVLSGIGSALLNVSRVRARHASEEGDHAADRLAQLLENRNELHHAVTVLHHVCALAAFACCVILLLRWFGPWGWLCSLAVILPVFLVGVEFMPKLLFRRYPFRLLRSLAAPLAVLGLAARPWMWLAKLIKHHTGDSSSQDDSLGLLPLGRTITALGVLPGKICAQVERFVTFQQLHAVDLLMPLAELVALPPDLPLTSAVALNTGPKHPWRAVLGGDGRLLGWLDMTALPAKPSTDKLVRQFMRPLLQVRAEDRVLRCLQSLRRRGEPVGAVMGAHGQSLGLVTQRELISTLFGPGVKQGEAVIPG